MQSETKKIILDVPYCSQYLDVPDHNWNTRSCGAACVKMVLDFKGVVTPELYEFVKKGNDMGAYGPHGWIHDKLIEMAGMYGVEMYREEKIDLEEGIEKLSAHIHANKPIIISVIKKCLGQTKYHVVVVTGVEEEGGQVKGFYFNEPESTTIGKGKNIFVNLEEFKKDWRRMAIFLK
jgi:hypothetical protein